MVVRKRKRRKRSITMRNKMVRLLAMVKMICQSASKPWKCG